MAENSYLFYLFVCAALPQNKDFCLPIDFTARFSITRNLCAFFNALEVFHTPVKVYCLPIFWVVGLFQSDIR